MNPSASTESPGAVTCMRRLLSTASLVKAAAAIDNEKRVSEWMINLLQNLKAPILPELVGLCDDYVAASATKKQLSSLSQPALDEIIKSSKPAAQLAALYYVFTHNMACSGGMVVLDG